MRFDLYNTATEQYEQRGVFASKEDVDEWNSDLASEKSNLRYIPSPANPPSDCRCGADSLEECVCNFTTIEEE